MSKWGNIAAGAAWATILLSVIQMIAGEKAQKEEMNELVDEKFKSLGTPIVLNREQRRKLERSR